MRRTRERSLCLGVLEPFTLARWMTTPWSRRPSRLWVRPWPTTMLRTAPTLSTGLVSRCRSWASPRQCKTTFGVLSGVGKRVSLAAGIAREPDLLFLDEPTNHLDLEGVEWLEQWMAERSVRWSSSPTTEPSRRPPNASLNCRRSIPGAPLKSKATTPSSCRARRILEAQAAEQSALANKVRRTPLGCGRASRPRDPPQKHGGRHQRPQGGSQSHHRSQ